MPDKDLISKVAFEYIVKAPYVHKGKYKFVYPGDMYRGSNTNSLPTKTHSVGIAGDKTNDGGIIVLLRNKDFYLQKEYADALPAIEEHISELALLETAEGLFIMDKNTAAILARNTK